MASDLEKLQQGTYRIVCAKRKRKLRKRGEFVWWSRELWAWVWQPKWNRR